MVRQTLIVIDLMDDHNLIIMDDFELKNHYQKYHYQYKEK